MRAGSWRSSSATPPAALLILRVTDLLRTGHSATAAPQLALVLYAIYNLAATLIGIPAGRPVTDTTPFGRGRSAAFFAAGYAMFAIGPDQPYNLGAHSG